MTTNATTTVYRMPVNSGELVDMTGAKLELNRLVGITWEELAGTTTGPSVPAGGGEAAGMAPGTGETPAPGPSPVDGAAELDRRFLETLRRIEEQWEED
jgi:hypothetical protein